MATYFDDFSLHVEYRKDLKPLSTQHVRLSSCSKVKQEEEQLAGTLYPRCQRFIEVL